MIVIPAAAADTAVLVDAVATFNVATDFVAMEIVFFYSQTKTAVSFWLPAASASIHSNSTTNIHSFINDDDTHALSVSEASQWQWRQEMKRRK